jgi:hypothetical protein
MSSLCREQQSYFLIDSRIIFVQNMLFALSNKEVYVTVGVKWA